MSSRAFYMIMGLMCYSSITGAQDLSGTWQGNFSADDMMTQPTKIVMELFRINDSTYNGATHLYYKRGKFEHYKINAKFEARTNKLTVSEDSVLSYKLGFGTVRSAGTYSLQLDPASAPTELTGEWKTKRKILFRYWTVGSWFSKVNEPANIVSNKAPAAGDAIMKDTVLLRQTDLQSLLEIDPKTTDSISIEIFDNATIDGDTISLYVDENLVLSKQHLSARALQLFLPVNKLKPISKLLLVAESLGTIPPCTALMIVKVGKKRYEINLSGTFTKNAVVELLLKE
jgi:hypothetical protein